MALNNEVIPIDNGVDDGDGVDFEDVGVNNDVSGSAFPVSSLAVAVAIERDRRQRNILVENMVRILVNTLDNKNLNNNDTSLAANADAAAAVFEVISSSEEGSSAANIVSAAGSETTPNTAEGSVDRESQHASIVKHILGEEFGSTTMTALSFSKTSAFAKTSTQWNKGKPLALHWVWQTSLDGDGTIEYSTCNLSILATEGAAIEFCAKAAAVPTSTAPSEAELGTDPLQYQEEFEKLAVCEIPKFQWTLEGTTKKASEDEEEILEDIQSFWKLESAIYSLTLGSFGDVITEEVLLEITDISLIGRIADSADNVAEEGLRLRSKSVLSLKASSNEDIGGSDEKKRMVGQALRTIVDYLDQLLSIPDVQLFLKNMNGPSSEAEAIPSFEESGDSMRLGGALKYYLEHYCNVAKKRSKLSTRFLSIGDSATTFGAMALTGTSVITPIGGLVSVAALAAKDGVAAAARKGKEVRISAQTATAEYKDKFGDATRGVTESIRDKSKEASEIAKTATADYRYKFGDATRGVTESIRELADKGKEVRIRQQQQQQSAAEGATMASGGNEFANRISMEFPERPPPGAGTDGADDGDGDGAFVAPEHIGGGERYKFGDFSRGLIGSIREKREQKKLSSSSPSGDDNTGTYLQENKGRFAGVAGGTAGAAAGMLIAGPVGALAGSVFGSMGGQVAVKQTTTDGENPTNENKVGFRLGDNFRNVVARGKEATGRGSSEGYKLGDFSRGLFASRGDTTNDAGEGTTNDAENK